MKKEKVVNSNDSKSSPTSRFAKKKKKLIRLSIWNVFDILMIVSLVLIIVGAVVGMIWAIIGSILLVISALVISVPHVLTLSREKNKRHANFKKSVSALSMLLIVFAMAVFMLVYSILQV